jgi:hypothetical protein
LANGLRRRAQSLNFAIRSNQSAVDSTRQSTLPLPAAKRRRKEPINNHSLSEINSSQRVTSRSKLLSQKIIQTRKKSASVVINNDLSSIPQKTNKTTRKRRRTDSFTRMGQSIHLFFYR